MNRTPLKDSHDVMARLDQAVPPESDVIDDYDEDPVLEAARRLARGPKPALPGVASQRIESQVRARHTELHIQAASREAPARWVPQLPWGQVLLNLRYVAASILAFISLGILLMAFSANALPGDDLYIVKLGVEEVRLTTTSDAGEAKLRVEFAARRMDEFERILKGRDEIHVESLTEASAQLNRALTLLAMGYGNREELDLEIANLSYRQASLIQFAAQIATPEEYASLSLVSEWNSILMVRVLSEGTLDYNGPVVITSDGGFTPVEAGIAPPIILDGQIPFPTGLPPADPDETPESNGENGTLITP